MTCIAGVVHDGIVTIGGDSAGVSGWSMTVRNDVKVFRNGPFLVGFTDSFRMGQLLRFKFKPPAHEDGLDTYEYMVTRFVDAIRECFKDGGYLKKESEQESGGTFLVGYRGRLFTICADYQVGEPMDPFAAVGCGSDIALGALHALRDVSPTERVFKALEAAERFSAGVRGPFTIETLKEAA